MSRPRSTLPLISAAGLAKSRLLARLGGRASLGSDQATRVVLDGDGCGPAKGVRRMSERDREDTLGPAPRAARRQDAQDRAGMPGGAGSPAREEDAPGPPPGTRAAAC